MTPILWLLSIWLILCAVGALLWCVAARAHRDAWGYDETDEPNNKDHE